MQVNPFVSIVFFIHLKLELLTQFTALNDEKIEFKKYTSSKLNYLINPFNPEFSILIFIHYKPRIAVAILDL